MKKMKKIALIIAVFMLMAVCFAFGVSANNDVETAIPVSLGEDIHITFETKEWDDEYDQIRWYSFTPSTTGYYKFNIDNPYYEDSENDTYICLYNSLSGALDDDFIIYEDMENDTDNVKFKVELNKNQKYYICIYVSSCLGIENPHTMSFSITEWKQPEGTNAQTAVPAEFEERFAILYDEFCEYYMKFTPEETGWYEINLDKFEPDETYITTYDSYGEEVGFGSWDQFTNECISCVDLIANQVYYIKIQCFSEADVAVSGTVQKHHHEYRYYENSRADEYEDGYITNECIKCEYIDEIVIPKVNISVSQTKFIYNGKKQVPVITITDRTGKTFTEGADFSVSYPESSIEVNDYSVFVSMDNEYYEVDTEIFYIIEEKSIEDLTVKLSDTKIYYGEKPTISIKGLKINKDFECDVWYWGLGEQEVTVYGVGNYTGEQTVKFTVYPANVTGLKVSKTTSSSITLSWKEDENYSVQYYQIYDVKKKKILATVDYYDTSYTIKKLKAGTAYSYKVRSYSKENGKKYYGEWVEITGVTKPVAASFTSLKSSKSKTFTAKWDKQTSATGYQIQYSTSSKFSSAKTVKITKNISTSKTVSNLKSGKKYYVKIRTYKIVKVNGKSKTVYSSWSKAMSVKVK